MDVEMNFGSSTTTNNHVKPNSVDMDILVDNDMEKRIIATVEFPKSCSTSSLSSLNTNLDELSRDELCEKIRRLQTHVKQLRNIILKRKICPLEKYDESSASATSLSVAADHSSQYQRQHILGPTSSKKKKPDRPFDFENYPKRHVALKLAYLGWNYTGLAAQEDSEETIETYLFEALIKAKLIESREISNYHRCGRTDKGVSAFSQVVSIDLRCKSTNGLGVILPDNWNQRKNFKNGEADSDDDELDFCRMLNRLLPRDIRVLAWSPVRKDFSARFDCVRRTYKYYFPEATDVDIERMKVGAQHLIGMHDFRNFCKLETNSRQKREKKSTVRTILDVDLTKLESQSSLYVLTIHGESFVWHQIRCIVAILIAIGKGQEEPSIIAELLDIESNPKKPQYAMAVDYPLVLFDVDHGDDIKKWRYDDTDYIIGDFQRIWVQNAIKETIISEMMKSLKQLHDDSIEKGETHKIAYAGRKEASEHLNSLIMGTKAKSYQKVMDRPTCERS